MPYPPRPPRPPRPPSNSDLTYEKLMSALATTTPVPKPVALTPLSPQNEALVKAVRDNDGPALDAAIKNGADVNAGTGKPLQVAAEMRNFALVQELVIRGADVATALAGLKEEQKSLGARGTLHDDLDVRTAADAMIAALLPQHGTARGASSADFEALLDKLVRQRVANGTTAGGKRAKEINETAKTLQDWYTRFVQELAPIEILRQQRQILDQLAEMKREIFPDRLDKPSLSLSKNAPKTP